MLQLGSMSRDFSVLFGLLQLRGRLREFAGPIPTLLCSLLGFHAAVFRF